MGGDLAVDGFGFLAGEAGDVGDGVFAGLEILIDMRGAHIESVTDLREELAPPGGSRSQNQHRSHYGSDGGREGLRVGWRGSTMHWVTARVYVGG